MTPTDQTAPAPQGRRARGAPPDGGPTYDDAAADAVAALPPADRQRGAASALPPPDPRARAYALALWRGAGVRRALEAAGLRAAQDWHVVASAMRDPAYRAVVDAALAAQAVRMRMDALQVVADALAGKGDHKPAVLRLAADVVSGRVGPQDAGGASGGGGPSGPSVVINMRPADGAVSRCNRVADSAAQVITAQVVDNGE